MSSGSAGSRLKKLLLFKLAKELNLHFCFRCGEEITDPDTFTIDHKVPWLDSGDPKGVFWDLDNIAFSHGSCNSRASRPRKLPHPSHSAYNKGCRCEGCKKIHSEHGKSMYYKRKQKTLL